MQREIADLRDIYRRKLLNQFDKLRLAETNGPLRECRNTLSKAHLEGRVKYLKECTAALALGENTQIGRL
jgi:hypothetical protein